MKKNFIFILILVVLIVGGWFALRKNWQTPQFTPTPSATVQTPTQTPSGLDITKFTKPATCRLSGSIKFTQKNLYISYSPLISYQGIDNDARLINWHISPQDDLSVGPNLFAALDIPDGSRSLTVGLPAEPKARDYTLTASVTYGRLVNGVVVVKEVRCSGSIPVYLRY